MKTLFALLLTCAPCLAHHNAHELLYDCRFDVTPIDAPTFQATQLGALDLLWNCEPADYYSITAVLDDPQSVGFSLTQTMEVRPEIIAHGPFYSLSVFNARLGIPVAGWSEGGRWGDWMLPAGDYTLRAETFSEDDPFIVDFGARSKLRHTMRHSNFEGGHDLVAVPEPDGRWSLLVSALAFICLIIVARGI